jgi:DNA-binding LacI/PurR family transcriptional regulator
MGAYLAGKGHRRVANVTGPSFFTEAMERAAGFDAGFEAAGGEIDPSLRFEGTYLPPSGRAAACWLLDAYAGPAPTAVFFGNYLMAAGAIAEFYDRGIRVPDDIAIALFDDLPQLDYTRPRITRVGNSPGALARRATAMLLERLNGSYAGPARTEVIGCTLHPLETA